jgi:hypothetical protein
MPRRILPGTAVPDAIVIHQLLDGFREGTVIHPLHKADGVHARRGEATLAGTKQPVLLPVMPQRGVAITVSVIVGEWTSRHPVPESDTVEIPRDGSGIRDLMFELGSGNHHRFPISFHEIRRYLKPAAGRAALQPRPDIFGPVAHGRADFYILWPLPEEAPAPYRSHGKARDTGHVKFV